MLVTATLVDAPFDDPGWIYEIKWYRYRAVAAIEKENAELICRNNLPFEQFSPINNLLENEYRFRR